MSDGNSWEHLTEIDSYIEELFIPEDPALEAALADSQSAGMPEIQVSPNQGKLLQMLAQIAGAHRILEIGTLGGYSTIHLARALPDGGILISLELQERHAEVARKNIERAGLGEKVEVRVGDAKEMLSAMADDGEGPFDLIFIDADKEGYPEYLEWSLRLARPGSVILADNTIGGGSVLDPHDKSAQVMREFNQMLADDERLSTIILPLLREYVDGLAIGRVVSG